MSKTQIIYQPKGQAGEYAEWATNPYRGCGHKCAYCYVPLVLHMPRAEFDAGALPRKDYLKRLEADARKLSAQGITPQVMLSFTTDPYHPGDTTLTRQTLEILIRYGFSFCTLTKGGLRALRDIDLFRPGQDAFASTLTSLDITFSLKWERAAATPANRMTALRQFHERGIYTWVSLEPTIDPKASLDLVRWTHQYVDLYKVGKANYIKTDIDWQKYTHDMVALCQKLGVNYYIKKDLQPYLEGTSHVS